MATQKLRNPRESLQTRFDGNGVEFRGKLIGYENIEESRGDKLCADALTRLKNNAKLSGAHKPKIILNVTKEGLKITDVLSKEVIQHAVYRISYISRDPTDNRAFGYIFSDENGQHRFYAIKTTLSAEMVVLALRDLFTFVYHTQIDEMSGGNGESEADKTTDGDNTDNVYEVPPSNEPVIPDEASQQVPVDDLGPNLLDLDESVPPPAWQLVDDIHDMFDKLHTSDVPSVESKPASHDLFSLSLPSKPAVGEPTYATVSRITSLPPPPPPTTVTTQLTFTTSLPTNVSHSSPFVVAHGTNSQTAPVNFFNESLTTSPFDDPFFNQPTTTTDSAWPTSSNDAFVNPAAVTQPSNPFLPSNATLQPMIKETKKSEPVRHRPTRVSKDQMFKDLVEINNPSAPFKTPKEMFKDLSNTPKKSLNDLQLDSKCDYISNETPSQHPVQDPFGFSVFGHPSTLQDAAAFGGVRNGSSQLL